MSFDTARAAFVRNALRYAAATDETVKTRYPKARSVVIDSNQNEQGARELAQKTLAANNGPRVFELQVEGILHLHDFVGGCPAYIPELAKHATDGRTMKVVAVTADYETGVSTLRLRG